VTARHRESGLGGLDDRRLAPSLRRAPVAEIERMLGLYRGLYRGFTVKHFHEQLGERHNYTLGCTVTKVHPHRAGLVQTATKRSAHRKKRPRRPMVGMTPEIDNAAFANWLAGIGLLNPAQRGRTYNGLALAEANSPVECLEDRIDARLRGGFARRRTAPRD
jgi:hypothetical protein